MATNVINDVSGDGSVRLVTWNLTTADPTGASFDMAQWADRTVAFTGTWGGATVVLEGTNDDTTWITLADPQGTAISKTADAVEAVLELMKTVRPRLSVVGAGATVKATLMARRANPMRT